MEIVHWDNLEKELLEDKEIKKACDELDLKYQVIRKIIEYRIRNNLTQKEFAKKIGLSQQSISRFERGLITPRIDFIGKLLNAMDMKIIIQ